MNKRLASWSKHIPTVLFFVLLAAHIFFQFDNLRSWTQLGFDQVDNAWAAVRILIEHRYPIVGMVAKNSSGIYIGPLYYYLVAIFYFITGMDPVASPILAGTTSVVSFFILFWVTQKIWNRSVALWTLFVYTFSLKIILTDRVQWPVNFIPIMSVLIFYQLYQIVCNRQTRNILWLAILIGLSFHIHFTSILYLPIIIACLPFFPRTKQSLIYAISGVGIFTIFLIPNIIFALQSKKYIAMQNYGSASIQSFHLRRFFQLAHDAFIQFEAIFPWRAARPFLFFIVPAYAVLSFFSENRKKWLVLFYLVCLWFFVPWFAFTLFRGEITEYYFTVSRFIAVISVAYIANWLWMKKSIWPKVFLASLSVLYILSTVNAYRALPVDTSYSKMIDFVEHADQKGNIIRYEDGNPVPLLYYIYRWKHGLPPPK